MYNCLHLSVAYSLLGPNTVFSTLLSKAVKYMREDQTLTKTQETDLLIQLQHFMQGRNSLYGDKGDRTIIARQNLQYKSQDRKWKEHPSQNYRNIQNYDRRIQCDKVETTRTNKAVGVHQNRTSRRACHAAPSNPWISNPRPHL